MSEAEEVRSKILAKTAKIINEFGWAVNGIHEGECEECGEDHSEDPDLNFVPFMYTTGLAALNLPELLIIGFCDRTCHGLINAVADLQKENGPFKIGDEIDLGGKYPLRVVKPPVDARDEMSTITRAMYGDNFTLLQLVLCDTDGHYPPDSRTAAPYNKQVVQVLN